MAAGYSARIGIALIVAAALAPFGIDTADAFFRFGGGGGGFGGFGGGFRPQNGSLGRGSLGPVGGRRGDLGGPHSQTGNDGSGQTVIPQHHWGHNVYRGPPHDTWPPVVGGLPPPYLDDPDEPDEPVARRWSHPRPPPRPPMGGSASPPPNVAPPPRPDFASRAAPPPPGETRYRAHEVLVEMSYTAPWPQVAEVLRKHRLIQSEAVSIHLLGVSLQRWRIADARTPPEIVRELAAEGVLARVQPNYVYSPAQAPDPAGSKFEASLSAMEYALVKMKVAPSLENAASEPIRVAVVDTAIDDTHPDLKGVVNDTCITIGEGKPARSKAHGTAMAGGIAADGAFRGVATRVKILSARAFDTTGETVGGGDGPQGTTLSIVHAIDWAADKKAQVVNMSFGGPNDPTLRDALAKADANGIALVGAAGNAGPKAPPQYPGADEHVIAVTATDEDNKLFSGANVGSYVALSAPGVDVLLPAANGGYAMETGTSVSSALVSGVVALMLERNPKLKPADIRQRLTASATPIGGAAHAREFGAGLVDASKAVAP